MCKLLLSPITLIVISKIASCSGSSLLCWLDLGNSTGFQNVNFKKLMVLNNIMWFWIFYNRSINQSRFRPNRNLTGTIHHWSVILRSFSVVLNSAKRDANGFFKVLLLSSHLLISRHPVQKSNFGACAVTGYCSFKSMLLMWVCIGGTCFVLSLFHSPVPPMLQQNPNLFVYNCIVISWVKNRKREK